MSRMNKVLIRLSAIGLLLASLGFFAGCIAASRQSNRERVTSRPEQALVKPVQNMRASSEPAATDQKTFLPMLLALAAPREAESGLLPDASTLLLTATQSANSSPPLDFYGVNFSNKRLVVEVRIQPRRGRLAGDDLVMRFIPGKYCEFGDGRACVRNFVTPQGGNVIFLSIHSGMGGEANAFRHAVEGTGVGEAGLSLRKIKNNLAALNSADIELIQGPHHVEGLTLVAMIRVPARHLEAYFDAPYAQALEEAARSNPSLAERYDPTLPLLVFETCGWRQSEEPWATGVSATTGSVYLGLIQIKP